MHVLISAVSRFQSPTGICRHAANMAAALAVRPEIRRLTFVTGDWQERYYREWLGLDMVPKVRVQPVSMRNNSLSRNLWLLRELPKLSRSLSSDIVHFSFPAPLRQGSFNCKTAVSVHDVYAFDVPGNFGSRSALLNQALLRKAIVNSDSVACVSDTTLQRVVQLFPEVRTKASRIFNVVQGWRVAATAPALRFKSFVLSVAQHRPNKNLEFALRGFQRLRERQMLPEGCGFVIVGSEGPQTKSLQRSVLECGLNGSVQMLTSVSESELRWLYENCLLLAVTSTVEGFCLPLVEATLSGCRIVCSDIPVLRELGSPGCHFFKLQDSVEGFVSAVERALRNKRASGTARTEFSPESIGEQYVALYTDLIGKPLFASAV